MPMSDAQLDAWLAGRPAAPLPDWLPGGFRPTWREGEPLGPAAARWLLGRLAHQRLDPPEVEVQRLLTRIDPVSAGPWVDSLLADPRSLGPEGFPFVARLLAALGAEPHLQAIAAHIDDLWSHHRALPLEALRCNASDGALRCLARIHDRAWQRKLGEAAYGCIVAVAEERGVPPWQLLEAVDPRARPVDDGLLLPFDRNLGRALDALIQACPPLGRRTAVQRFEARDYRPTRVESPGLVYRHSRLVHGYLVHIEHSAVPVKRGSTAPPVALEALRFGHVDAPETILPWEVVPPPVRSVAFEDLRSTAGQDRA